MTSNLGSEYLLQAAATRPASPAEALSVGQLSQQAAKELVMAQVRAEKQHYFFFDQLYILLTYKIADCTRYIPYPIYIVVLLFSPAALSLGQLSQQAAKELVMTQQVIRCVSLTFMGRCHCCHLCSLRQPVWQCCGQKADLSFAC
jgi:hypothetical protein